jgi:hypothetical protein
MARPPKLSGSDRAKLSAAMDRALGAGKVESTGSLRDMIARFGRPAVIDSYAKAAGIKRASARDAITRYEHGKRAPSSRTLGRLSKAQRSKVASERLRGQAGVRPSITATFRVSRTEWLGRAQARDMDAVTLNALADAYESDDMDRVADIIAREYGRSFHANLSGVENIEDFEL